MFNTGCSKAVKLSSFVLLLVMMPVSVPLSYKCAVYFLIKNVHFILGSVKVDDLGQPSAITRSAPSINYYNMLCSPCKRSMLFCQLFFPIRYFCVKIS